MVGRLVEDEQVGAVEGREPEQQPRLLAAREVVEPGVVDLRAEKPIWAERARTCASGASGISSATWSYGVSPGASSSS